MKLIKVTRKSQITIPQEIREKLGIKEGDLLCIDIEGDRIVIEKPKDLKPGEPVGEEEYRKIISELEEIRKKWR